MNIVFVNNSQSLNGIGIKEYNSNPGIGGTEYVTLKLIFELNNYSKTLKVGIASEQKIISNEYKIFSKENFIENSIVICPVSQINYLKELKFKICRVIFWSHHPHDYISNFNNVREMISLGEYQHCSNQKNGFINYLIKNPSPKPIKIEHLPRIETNVPENFVYIGAIGPAKGLHLVLSYWPKIRKSFPKSKLNIIGGNLYREKNHNSKRSLFFKKAYKEVIEGILNRMSAEDKQSIKFLGLLTSKEKDLVLKHSDVALLNPTGKSEAAPASPLECYCYGIPVVAGGDFGAFDNMKYFPELDLKKDNINKIINTLSNKKKFLELRKRSYRYSKQNFETNSFIYRDWEKLFMEEMKAPKIKLPFYLNIKLHLRDIYYRNLKYKIKKYFYK